MSREPSWAEVVLIALNVAQTLALAWISDRGRRIRSTDLRGDHESP